MSEVDISIVMCTHNRAAALREALDSLLVQETDGKFQYEIVLVHTGCQDGTLDVIEQAQKNGRITVRAVHEPRRGQVVARNAGLAAAKGSWIANFDDDQAATPSWLKELFALAQERNCLSVGGALRLRLPADFKRPLSPVCQRMLGATNGWNSVRPYTRKEGPGSGNQMIHRSVFDKVGNYDESFTLRGYDTDMYRRIREAGYESWYTPQAVAYHVIPPDRLDDEYFRETALHNGWSFARRDYRERGPAFILAVVAARVAQAACINVPRLLATRLQHSPEKTLDARIRLWRCEGYTRSALYALAPGLFRQSRFFQRFEFRAEARMLAKA